jgi:DNA-binding NtrC family response regulator
MTDVPFAGRLLIVEPDPARAAHLRDSVRDLAHVDGDADFHTARAHLFSQSYDWLVTNVRIGAYNGLHLVHLVDSSKLPVRALVYADQLDLCLARQAQQLGAFYESGDRVDRVLPAYLRSKLPRQDRRSLAGPDRRTAFRGSRRCGDSSSAVAFA